MSFIIPFPLHEQSWLPNSFARIFYVTLCLDLEIRVQAVAIANLQEANIGLEQRIEDLEDSITGNYFYLNMEKF